MLKILIVEDSLTETAILRSLFQVEKDMQIVGYAKNGEEAVKLCKSLKPDLITMDIAMPIMDGIEATRMIMSQTPTPIVIISSHVNDKALNAVYLSLEAGALTVIEKPINITDPSFLKKRKYMLDTLRSMAEIKVIKRRFYSPSKLKSAFNPSLNSKQNVNYEIIAIGASVGGPQALRQIIAEFPRDFPVPIVVVQHMADGFIQGFVNWLNEHCALNIKYAVNQEELLPGTVYFAPDYHHMEVKRSQGMLCIHLNDYPSVSGFKPSITVLLESVATSSGKNGIGVILTGMGSDGAAGLLALKKAQGLTLIQDAESAVIFGMAGVAQSMGAVDEVIPLNKMAMHLLKLIKYST